MLNQVISTVLQLALDFCSIPGGTCAVKNLICKKIIYFEVSCCDWECLNDQTICALCKKEAIFTSCDARIILEQDLANKIVTSKHFGVHIYSKQVHERKEGVEKLV